MNVQPIDSNLGPSLLKQARLVLGNAAIKQIPVAEIILAPAPIGPKINIPFQAILACQFSVEYDTTGIDYLTIGTGNDDAELLIQVSAGDFVNNMFKILTPKWTTLEISASQNLDQLINQPLTLSTSGDGTPFTLGADDNRLTVSLLYGIFNLATGLYEAQ